MPIARPSTNYEALKESKKKLISTFHSARKKYFVASSAFCGNAKFLQFCLLLLLKFFYIFEDRHINRGRIYASQPPQGGTEKIYPAFVSSSHTAKLYLFLYFEKKTTENWGDGQTLETQTRRRERKKKTLRHTIFDPPFFQFASFLINHSGPALWIPRWIPTYR